MSCFPWFLGSGQKSKIVGLFLSDILTLISGHLEFSGPSYGHFTSASQIAFLF